MYSRLVNKNNATEGEQRRRRELGQIVSVVDAGRTLLGRHKTLMGTAGTKIEVKLRNNFKFLVILYQNINEGHAQFFQKNFWKKIKN